MGQSDAIFYDNFGFLCGFGKHLEISILMPKKWRRCFCHSLLNHDFAGRNAIITPGAWNWAKNENGIFWCLESSESIIGWNWTWVLSCCNDSWLLLQCYHCMDPVLHVQWDAIRSSMDYVQQLFVHQWYNWSSKILQLRKHNKRTNWAKPLRGKSIRRLLHQQSFGVGQKYP